MKTGGKQCKTTVRAHRKNGLGCTKSVTTKTTKQRRTTTGKKNSPEQPSPLQTKVMQTSLQETGPGNYTLVSKQCLQCREKLKMQLFPIDEVTRKGVEQGQHNPYLELILTTRKKISSVVKHLNVKWGSSKSSSGELMLFPYNAQIDTLASHRRWTIKDSDITAADVYASIGNPAIFRLRYGWFSNSEPTTGGILPTPLHSEDNLQTKEIPPMNITDMKAPQCPVSSMENEPVDTNNSLNQVPGEALVLDKSVQAVDNLGKSDVLSWADDLSNISIGALLSETSPALDVNFCHPLPAQKNSSLQQIPITCDSFDVAIASLVAHHQTTNQSTQVLHSSIWDAEETCHAFPFHKISSSNNDPASSKDALMTTCVGSNSVGVNDVLGTQVGHASAEHVYQEPVTNLQIQTKSDAIPELAAGLQPNAQDNANKELKTSSEPQIEALRNSDFGRVDIYWPESLATLEHVATCSRQMNGGDTLNLGASFETSLDAFQNFSIF
ncbi:TSL-kinase interacting protein 1 [Elaeis guineensis]|uniref:TSL-kinase interacting protein 1 n=1 Tax=Elaeis guineensis var. tenera TaxID=51953 RepID=A0A6J0PKN2_ELAGV|nr:TSL-kinase interacting protein 1 [Elaeis guineensis]XP_010925335.1 TSL-kinase interacting protein 1 [Elaeis guineensis]XP_019707227.1 TSL-kinase interacting protein 1 [Elaeis guineensis]XP_019707231.1 TSL-kinase interacting protein 1 [Elaeis guineensis]XP_029121256.1 TSL-kinase interacting protein 1 [Elaeis guineensis]